MGVTREIAQFAVETKTADLPPRVMHETKRDVINVTGVALYAARDPSLRMLLNVFEAEGGNTRAAIWGTNFRTTLQNAAVANGYLAHLEDYDDTHFPTVIHPSAPTVPAAFAIGEVTGASGREVLAAIALGIEVCCRFGVSVHPWHYDAGWHITGTAGVFGSAVAAGRLLGLDIDQMTAALGIAGTQAAGVRETFGSMSKPFHAGRAAQAGVTAVLLAKEGFTSTDQIFEGRRGVAAVMSSDRDLSRLTDGLGESWELFQNGLKPYACGVVSHPSIDAAVSLRARPGFDADAVESVEARVHPLVPELMGRKEPRVGLEGKFSVYHCIACGLIDGAAFPAQFTDARVLDERIAGMRQRVNLVVDEAMPEDAVMMRVTMRNGSVLEESIAHATGSPENPMTDARLEEKFTAVAAPTLGESEAHALLSKLWVLDEAPNLRGLTGLVRLTGLL